LRIPTVSHEDPTQTNGETFLELRRLFEKNYPLVHARLKREIISDYSMLFTWAGEDDSLQPMILVGHMDAVRVDPVTESEWTQPPFSGAVTDGFIWGRGALDDKGPVVAILEATEKLLQEGFQPRRTIYLAFGHNEETTGWGAKATVDLLESRNIEPAYVLDEGGRMSSGVMGIDFPVARVGISEKGYVSVVLTVESQGGHSSRPPAETTIGVLSEAIRSLEGNQMPGGIHPVLRRELETVAPWLPYSQRLMIANLWLFGPYLEARFASTPGGNAKIRTTTAPTVFHAGMQENVLPTRAEAIVNFRILPGDSVASVVEHVETTIDNPRITVRAIEETKSEPSPVSNPDSSSFARIAETIRQIYPEVPVVTPYLVGGATDARYYSRLSPNVYRFKPFLDEPPTTHGIDERISVEGHARGVKFYLQLIRNTSGEM
jgi:carboxypeptidase PM20D1